MAIGCIFAYVCFTPVPTSFSCAYDSVYLTSSAQ